MWFTIILATIAALGLVLVLFEIFAPKAAKRPAYDPSTDTETNYHLVGHRNYWPGR